MNAKTITFAVVSAVTCNSGGQYCITRIKVDDRTTVEQEHSVFFWKCLVGKVTQMCVFATFGPFPLIATAQVSNKKKKFGKKIAILAYLTLDAAYAHFDGVVRTTSACHARIKMNDGLIILLGRQVG